MGENISNRLSVLDFIIAVLRQHEKNLDKSLANLENILERLGKMDADENLGGKMLNVYSRVPPREDYLHERQRMGNQLQKPFLKQIEYVVFRLAIEGRSVEEIALRLDMNPTGVRQIIKNLVRKRYLPPDNSLTGLGNERI